MIDWFIDRFIGIRLYWYRQTKTPQRACFELTVMHQTFFTILYLGCVGPGVGASVPPDEDGHRDLQAQGHHGKTQVGPDHLRYCTNDTNMTGG